MGASAWIWSTRETSVWGQTPRSFLPLLPSCTNTGTAKTLACYTSLGQKGEAVERTAKNLPFCLGYLTVTSHLSQDGLFYSYAHYSSWCLPHLTYSILRPTIKEWPTTVSLCVLASAREVKFEMGYFLLFPFLISVTLSVGTVNKQKTITVLAFHIFYSTCFVPLNFITEHFPLPLQLLACSVKVEKYFY